MDIIKIVGKSEREIEGYEPLCKLHALKTAIGPLMRHMNGTGTWCEEEINKIVEGIDYLFNDVFTEIDQIFYDGRMERLSEGKEEKYRIFSKEQIEKDAIR